jgi:hypothetical protein
MTREEAKELLPIIKAYSEGKTIEYSNCFYESWETNNDISFTGKPDTYRIKPEPKYRPFKDAKEFEPYRERWIMPINRKHSYCKVTDYSNDTLYVDTQQTDFESAFDSYTFDDGTPFGIQEAE